MLNLLTFILFLFRSPPLCPLFLILFRITFLGGRWYSDFGNILEILLLSVRTCLFCLRLVFCFYIFKMYKCEPHLPSNSKVFKQAMYTWWRREHYMSVHPTDLNFSGQMSYLYPTPYPIGIWNPWAFNMGMNNMDSAVLPCFESGSRLCKPSRINEKTNTPRVNKSPEKGFQPEGQANSKHIPPAHPTNFKQQTQLSPRNLLTPPVHPSSLKQQDQLSPRFIPPPVHPSCFIQDHLDQKQKSAVTPAPVHKQPSQTSSKQISPLQHTYPKPNKNSSTNPRDASRNQVCRFCLQNGERQEFYSSHQLKDKDGNVTCPILQRYVCDICKATGVYAHTRAYCPFYKEKNKKPLAVVLKQTNHDSCGRIRK